MCWRVALGLLAPLILTTDLLLFLRSEVVLDVEMFADFFRSLSSDHLGDCFAC
eukprot:m.430029 g.430029  ORF g.430029 m.430029 type:complete len:53 (-) comp17106_c0_seq1:423-581(-)